MVENFRDVLKVKYGTESHVTFSDTSNERQSTNDKQDKAMGLGTFFCPLLLFLLLTIICAANFGDRRKIATH